MPDSNGRIPPVAFRMSDEEWERVFEPEPELDTEEPEFEIEWTPDWSLDGATFTPDP